MARMGYVKYSGNTRHYSNGIESLFLPAIKAISRRTGAGATWFEVMRWLNAKGYTYKRNTVYLNWQIWVRNGYLTGIHEKRMPLFRQVGRESFRAYDTTKLATILYG